MPLRAVAGEISEQIELVLGNNDDMAWGLVDTLPLSNIRPVCVVDWRHPAGLAVESGFMLLKTAADRQR